MGAPNGYYCAFGAGMACNLKKVSADRSFEAGEFLRTPEEDLALPRLC